MTPAPYPENAPVSPQYEGYDKCNACGCNQLDVEVTSQVDHITCEASIKCRLCWFEDYWAYGYLESVQEIGRLNCSTYG